MRDTVAFWKRPYSVLAAATLLVSAFGATAAIAQQAVTPRPGSAERTRILDAIRGGPRKNLRFIVHHLFVMKGKDATFAYAAVEPSKQESDGGEYILEASGTAKRWRIIWSVQGGGTSDCSTAAEYYRSVERYLKAHGISAGALNPGHTQELKNLAASEDGCWTIGDLGPELPGAGD